MTGTNRPKLLLVNYHYVRSRDAYPHPGIYPVEPEAFRTQVQWFAERFHMPSPGQVEAFVHGEGDLPGPSVFLTFDDGLVDHHRVAGEILTPMGIRAAFFVSSRPLVDRKALLVHKVHWLRATTEPAEFRREFTGLVPRERLESVWSEEAERAARETYIYDSPEDARLKYLINFLLPNPLADEVSGRMLRDRGLSEEAFCSQCYMGERQIRELARDGHVVGNHGHSHVPFSTLSDEELSLEVRKSKPVLEGISGEEQRWVSYPYGRTWALPADPSGFCRRFGFSVGMALDGGWNEKGRKPHRLMRVNENDVSKVVS